MEVVDLFVIHELLELPSVPQPESGTLASPPTSLATLLLTTALSVNLYTFLVTVVWRPCTSENLFGKAFIHSLLVWVTVYQESCIVY